MHSRHTFTACSADLSCYILSPPGQLIGLLFVLLRNHAAMLRAFTTYSNTATLVKYYCPKLTTCPTVLCMVAGCRRRISRRIAHRCGPPPRQQPSRSARVPRRACRRRRQVIAVQASLINSRRQCYTVRAAFPVSSHALPSSYTVLILCSTSRRRDAVCTTGQGHVEGSGAPV